MDLLDLRAFAGTLSEGWLYGLLALAGWLENLCPLLPGDLTAAWAIYLLASGRVHTAPALLAATAGSWLAFVSFAEGSRALRRAPWFDAMARAVPPVTRQRWHAFLLRHGLWAVLAHRFVPGSRTAIALAAGFLGLPRSRTAAVSLVSILIWHALLFSGGNWISSQLAAQDPAGGIPAPWMVVIVVALLLIGISVRKRTDVVRPLAAIYCLGFRAQEFWTPAGEAPSIPAKMLDVADPPPVAPGAAGQDATPASGEPPARPEAPGIGAPHADSKPQPMPHSAEARVPGSSALLLGLDVGSTTVKAVVVDSADLTILWKDYQRHYTHQAETVVEFLTRIEAAFPHVPHERIRIFVTGSGAQPLAAPLGAKFVQEVNAVTMAVERLNPTAQSVVELGGQDAKIIIFKRSAKTGERLPWTSMNDRCASGTGATIDKCLIKVGLAPEQVSQVRLGDRKLHHVAAKCGVFAEMDIVNLIKSGVPAEEVLCSLGDAIVQQNLSLLARGNTLKPDVLLLGGPIYYLPFLQDCWRRRLRTIWDERGLDYLRDVAPESLIAVPDNALYYAAYGAVVYGRLEKECVGRYLGRAAFERGIGRGRAERFGNRAGAGLVADDAELARFRAQYRIPAFQPPALPSGTVVRAALGVDGGSTSTKAVLLAEDGTLLRKAYRLSGGNPIQDVKELLAQLKASIVDQGATLEIAAFGVTGYAAGVLEKTLQADVNIVETVAHMQSAQRLFGDVHVICDVGGQDIKVLFLNRGELRDFRLSNQCSAGNGMLLQAVAGQFGVPVEQYAECAFQARVAPKFSYGCAVFLDSDRVNFQKEGFTRNELMAGLAMVLPKNIWQYVVQIPRMEALGKVYVLQGGTQYNQAAVKAQVDYILERVPGAEIHVHPYPGEAGAIGAALEASRQVQKRGHSTFVGMDQAISIECRTRTDESTSCRFCTNRCARTFIETRTSDGTNALYISGFSCERGTVADIAALKAFNREQRECSRRYPNLAVREAQRLFAHQGEAETLPDAATSVELLLRSAPKLGWVHARSVRRGFRRSSAADAAFRAGVRIGIPRCLDMWNTAPFWRAYFEALGIAPSHVAFSKESGELMFAEGAKYGSVDPCYPAKVVQAHIHQLLMDLHTAERPLHFLFFPTVNQSLCDIEGAAPHACPIVTGTANVMKAAFTKEVDYFAARGIAYVDDEVNISEPGLFQEQAYAMWGRRLRVTRDESDFAIAAGFRALERFKAEMEAQGRVILEAAQRDRRYCILLLARPYHLDPGLSHGVTEACQALGYPVVTLRSIPKDSRWLGPFFADDLAGGRISSPLDLSDVWPEAHTGNSALKVWGAKFAARHGYVAVLDLSSFKCGHDSPTYGLISNILDAADVPHLALHDMDANRPTGTLQIRIKTFVYSLQRREQALAKCNAQAPDTETAAASAELFSAETPHFSNEAQT